jgi:hypothetical protein
VTVVVLGHEGTVAKSVTVGILNSANQVVHDRVVPVVGSTATVALNGLVAYGLELGAPLHTPAVVGALAVSTVKATTVNSGPLTHRLVLNQVLQGVLEPPRWRYRTEIGGLPVFANTLTRGATWLEPAGSPTPLAALISSARATTSVVEAWQNPVTYVSTPRAGVLVRSVAFEPGWRALVTPAGGGPTATVKVRQLGLVQAISLPRGRFKVTWVYTSKRAIVGLLVSVLSTIALMVLLFLPRRRRRPGTAGRAGPAAGPEPQKDLEPEELVVAAGESDSADERFPLAHPSAPG